MFERKYCIVMCLLYLVAAISPLQAMFRAPRQRPQKVKAPKARKLSTKTPEVPKAPTAPAMSAPAATAASAEMPEMSAASATVPMAEIQEVPEVSIVAPTKTKQVPAFTPTKSSSKTSLSWWEQIKAYLIPKRSRPFSTNYALSFDANKLFKLQNPFAWKVKELIEKSSAREAVSKMKRFARAEGAKQFIISPQIPLNPAVTEKEAIEMVAKAAEQDIQKAHEQQNLPLVEKGLMVCTPPGINSALLLEFDSIEAIQAYFKEQYRLLDLEYKKNEDMNDAAFNKYVAKKERDDNYLRNTYYKQPYEKVVHDKRLPTFVLEETKRILKLVGINPLSVNILASYEYFFGAASGPILSIKNGMIDVEKPARIFYNVNIIEEMSHESIVFLIAHEIGHLLCNHMDSIEQYPELIWGRRHDDPTIEALEELRHKIDLLHELEADVAIALFHKDIAHIIHESLLKLLANPHTEKTFPTSQMLSPIHQSPNDRYLWIQRINELHKKRAQKSALFGPAGGVQLFDLASQTPLNPNLTEKEAIEIVAKAAEQDIKKAHEQQNLPLVEKGLMVCTPPGINSALLLEFDPIEKIQAVFKEQYRLLDLEYKKIENMDDVTFNEYVAKKNRDRNYLENTYYKQPCELAVHDIELPVFILEETKRILTLVGINPLSVSILTMAEDDRGMAAGGARGPSISIKNGVIDVEEPAVIFYNMSLIERLDHKSIVFLIAHEIGHLLCNHGYSIQEYPQAGYLSLFKAVKWTTQKRKAAEKLRHKINLFNELEADVTVACLNKEVAQVIHEHLLEVLAKPHRDNTFPTNVMLTNIHQSSNERYLWIQRINELHKKHAQQSIP